MLKMHDSTVRRSIHKFTISATGKTVKTGLAVILAGMIFSVLAFGQQSLKEHIYMNGKAITTETSAAGCMYGISAISRNIAATGGTGNVSVSCGNGCSWNATSNAPSWIHVSSGSGTATYSVDANNGAARSGTITIAGQAFTINQANGCSYTLNPTSAGFPAAGDWSSFTVTTASGCSWTASSNSAWIAVTAGSSGTGNGTVSYSVDQNTNGARDGSISVGNFIHYVGQDAYSTCDLELMNACWAEIFNYEYCAFISGCQ